MRERGGRRNRLCVNGDGRERGIGEIKEDLVLWWSCGDREGSEGFGKECRK